MNGENPQHEAQPTSPERERAKDIAIKSLAALGLIALLAFGTWGTFQIIRNSPDMVASITAAVSNFTSRFFSGEDTTLNIALRTQSVKSGEAFDFTWERTGFRGDDSYAFVYECADELTFITPQQNGGTKRITCGEPYIFSTSETTLKLTPLSLNNRFLDATVKLSIVRNEEIVAEDSVLLTIVNERVLGVGNGSTTGPTTTPKTPQTGGGGIQYRPVYTTVTVPTYSDPNGYVDLEVDILAVGIIEGNNDTFEATRNELDRSEKGGVQFVVRNIGTKTSEEWTFSVELPTSPRHTFRPRENQRALAPGERIEYTLGFDKIARRDNGEIVITVDPRRNLEESNRGNNTESIEVTIDR